MGCYVYHYGSVTVNRIKNVKEIYFKEKATFNRYLWKMQGREMA